MTPAPEAASGAGASRVMPKRVEWADFGREAFRIFFPEGVLAGMVGVGLWPLYFLKLTNFYPGQAHARIMAYGMFGAFIFGFLGTAMPRLLSAPALGVRNVTLLFILHFAMVLSFAAQKIFLGDCIFLILLLFFLGLMALRLKHRHDTPPPGFVLVGLAFVCLLAGSVLGLAQHWMDESGAYWVALQRRLSYQGFILLPILGIGPFLLPRFFGMPSSHDLPENKDASMLWRKKAALATVTGLLILGSFLVEVESFVRTGYAIRFAATLGYLLLEFPFRHAPRAGTALGTALRIPFVGIVCGFLFIALFPAFRTGLLHVTLVGGFAVITFTVATRVVFGHSGNLEKLKQKNRWLLVAVGLMLFAMATRISGDFWPKIMASHYIYGALLWLGATLLWSVYVLPKILKVKAE